jgi:hypothetical protein
VLPSDFTTLEKTWMRSFAELAKFGRSLPDGGSA